MHDPKGVSGGLIQPLETFVIVVLALRDPDNILVKLTAWLCESATLQAAASTWRLS